MEAEALAAAIALLDAFAANDRDGYFACFAPGASFLFHTMPHLLPNRAAYEAEYDAWVRDAGFKVLAFQSGDQTIALHGDTAVFTHASTTTQVFNGETVTLNERETIVFQKIAGKFLGIHEHLALA
jgi:hypothetical protein